MIGFLSYLCVVFFVVVSWVFKICLCFPFFALFVILLHIDRRNLDNLWNVLVENNSS